MTTPYTRRERRANIAGHGPEAYPGQHAKLLAMLEAHDADRAAAERDLAAEARAGGRAMTAALAHWPTEHPPTEAELRALWGDR